MLQAKRNLGYAVVIAVVVAIAGNQLWKAFPSLWLPLVVVNTVVLMWLFRCFRYFLSVARSKTSVELIAPGAVIFHLAESDAEYVTARNNRFVEGDFNHFYGRIATPHGDRESVHFWIPRNVGRVRLFQVPYHGWVAREVLSATGPFVYGKRAWVSDIHPENSKHEIEM